MKITVNHVHSGSIELTQKEPPKAAPEQQNTTENVRRDNIRDKLNWALIGCGLGIGGSLPANVLADMLDGLCTGKPYPCCKIVSLIISFLIFFAILCWAYRMSRKL